MSDLRPEPSISTPEEKKAAGAEFIALHTRVIALENLVIAVLAAGSEHQRNVAREMATYIAPRPGFTAHRLTVHASAHMLDLVERASRFRGENPE